MAHPDVYIQFHIIYLNHRRREHIYVNATENIHSHSIGVRLQVYACGIASCGHSQWSTIWRRKEKTSNNNNNSSKQQQIAVAKKKKPNKNKECALCMKRKQNECVCVLSNHKHTTFFNQDIFGIELGKRYNENNIRGPGVKSSRETSPFVEPLLETQTKISLFLSAVLHGI